MGRQNIAKLIDHSLLSPDATEAGIAKLCGEARKYGFFSVCVHPFYIKTAKKILVDSGIKTVAVIGFPSGASLTEVKVFEAMEAALCGADELDIVMNIGSAKSGKWKVVEKEISDITAATPDSVHKIIIETCYLMDDEIKKASSVIMDAGAQFVKTSTGFGPAGANIRDIELIKSATGGKIGIKAAGGIKTLKDVLAFVEAGATRIGTSSGVGIMKEVIENTGR